MSNKRRLSDVFSSILNLIGYCFAIIPAFIIMGMIAAFIDAWNQIKE